MVNANVEYAKVLRAVNDALKDPIKVKNDHIFMIIMLLVLYEEVTTALGLAEGPTNHLLE